ncbi:major facilitator superfamily domain-containing protein 12 isoform X2, partial [Tanacetum coccineum]
MMVDEVAVRESPVAIGRWLVLFYGVGHMLNDITVAYWFTYLLVFMTDIGLSPRDAATVTLSGQVADGFTAIFAGELVTDVVGLWGWTVVSLSDASLFMFVRYSRVFLTCPSKAHDKEETRADVSAFDWSAND